MLLSDRLTPAGITLLYAALAALWIVLSGYLLTLSITDPLLQGRIELAKGLAFVAVTSGLLYLLLNHWRESHAMQPAQTELPAPPKIIRLVLIFIALVLLVPLLDFAIYRLHVPQTKHDAYDKLQSIALFKAEEIENWLSERRGDAQVVAADTGFAEQVERFLIYRKRNTRLSKQILNQFGSLRAYYGYDSILLLDSSGRLLSSLGKDVDVPPRLMDLLRETLSSRQVQFSDLYRDTVGNINMDWVAPIVVSDRHGKRAVAAVVLRAQPAQFLYPLIQTWPSASASGETMLARREGGSVILLNQLRQRKDTALTTHGSVNDPDHPTAIAIRENSPGTAPGTDYRQVQVLAAYRPIAGTDWHLIAKIDRDEVLKPVWNLLYWVSAIASIAVALMMAVLLIFLRQQQRSHRLALRAHSMEAIRESELRFRTLVSTIPDLIWLKDKDGIYMNCNRQFERLYGAREADIVGKTDYDFVDKELADFFRKHDLKAMADDKPSINEEWLTFAENGYRGLFETIKTPMKDAKGNLAGVLGISRDITERKQADQKLQSSALKHQLLFESSRDALMILTPPLWRFTGANQATAELFGASSVAEFTSLGPWDISPERQPDGRPSAEKAQEVIATAMREGSCLFEWEHRRLDGQPFTAEVLLTRMKLGEEVFLQATVRDISERKLAEKALQDSEARYRRITEGLTDYQYTVRIENGRAVETTQSTACMTVTGYTAEEFSANPHLWIQMVVPEDRELVTEHVRQILAGKDVPPIEHRIIRKNGELCWVSDTTILFKDASGKLLSYDGVIKDITERKKTEELLHKLSQAVEQSPSTIVITDLKANIEYANAAFVKESGYSLAEAIGKNPKLLHSGKTPKSTYDDMWAHLANGKPWEGEFINRRKDGSEYIESALISPVFQADGRVTNFLAVKENITGRKAAEAKIHRLTQLYVALSQCNEAIVRCTSEEELFPKICRDAVQFGGMQMVWIGMVDESNKRVKPVASYGTGTEYLEGIQISLDADDPFGRGPTGTAIRDNHPYWNQDFQLDPNTAPWQERRKKYRWKASAALPLLRNGIPVGSITLYSDTVNAFDDEARGLLVEMAMDISFALDNFAREATRKHGEQELLDSEQRFRGLVEQSLAGIYIIQDGKLVYVNPRAAEIVGHGSVDDLIGKDLMQFIADADQGNVAENMRKLLYKEVPNAALEFCVVHTEGHTISVGANASYAFYHGQPAVIGLMQDISEKKHDEERILKYVDQLKSTFLSTVQLATSLSEMRDPYTAGHERRVSEIAVAIATELGLDEQRIEGIKVAGYLHDIGKISIPSEILVKPGRLNATEYALVQGHAQASYDVLKIVPFPWPVATIALQHHERMDGSGYPNKLKGDEILLESRIMAVADVVEAMASHRPYRPGLGIDKALAEIERGSGTLYDPVVAAACLRMFREQSFVLPPY